ncbi:hypothetical protein C8Q77DRAFT_1237491 [Trametes polyzona]|nr:hypothetical protein C8Q77DRAFT_1237491 [Trametes polyzona]
MFASIALLALAPLLVRHVHAAGFISCTTSHLAGGVGNIPIHIPAYNDGSTTYYGGPFASACPTMVGRPADDTEDWLGGNGGETKKVRASFWITRDQCMNVLVNGVHHYCCTDHIAANDAHRRTMVQFRRQSRLEDVR